MKNYPEIVAPGGSNYKAMVAAHYGAEAVYLGAPNTSLRMRQNKVSSLIEVKKIVDQLHVLGVKAYLTMNIFPRNEDIKMFESTVEQVSKLGADAIIFSDPGTYSIIKKYLPNVDLHLSTQFSTLNYETVKFWHNLGIKRVILARELHIREIAEIKKTVPNVELEIFVHGAMCMSYSGRCVLGEYFSGREANKGECSHTCRFKYRIFAEEERRKGKLIELSENINGTYIFSSKDLCTIDRLSEIIPYVDGLKIEGRSKGELYVGATVKAYRHARDCWIQDKAVTKSLRDLVDIIPHRTYWDGFLFHDMKTEFPENESISHDSAGPIINYNYLGLVLPDHIMKDGKAFFKVITKNNIAINDKLLYISPSNNGLETISVEGLLNSKNEPLENVTCNMNDIYVSFDKEITGWEILCK